MLRGALSWRPLTLPTELQGLREAATAANVPPAAGTKTELPFGRVDLFTEPLPRGAAESCPADDDANRPISANSIPGHRIDGIIGSGGMGTVYLARQLSLDRPVAVKVMSKLWASDAVFVARFVREAYAAAQLNHPNVVQIYDIGEACGSRYFSMEYVQGKSLSAILKERGKLDTEAAVGYVLQAARGLKYAHDRGIIHRDVKPDNLLVDHHGLVKVADLGLVKTPDLTAQDDTLIDNDLAGESGLHTIPSDMTGVRMALGTPAYMAPEQCRDASAVDHRADIYSLGCTLYALVTGSQPFQAPDSVALMKKHAYEPVVPPEQLNPRVPADVSLIIRRMMAKDPNERFPTMGDAIRVLERWLGLRSPESFAPHERQTAEVERLVAEFYASPTARVRDQIVGSVVSGTALAALLMVFFGQMAYAFGFGAFVIQAAVFYHAIVGWQSKSYLDRRLRGFVAGMSIGDAVVAIGSIVLFGAFLWLSDLLVVWLGFGMIGLASALALVYGFDRRRDVERFPALEKTDRFVRSLHRDGIAEADILAFVAKAAGKRWEEFFEAAFGYEAKIAIRSEQRGVWAGGRTKYAAWREPIIALLNRIEAHRKKSREHAMLLGSEYERLVSAGIPKWAARAKARRTAEALMADACVIRESQLLAQPEGDARKASQRLLFAPSDSPHESEPSRLNRAIELAIGAHIRVVLSAMLLALCGWWVYQNGLFTFATAAAVPRPLSIPGIDPVWTNWCDTINVAWGGLLLMASLFFRGQRMAALSLLGAAIAVAGHKWGIRTVEPVKDVHVAMLLGTVLALVGYRLGRP